MPTMVTQLEILLLMVMVKGETTLRQQWITKETGVELRGVILVPVMRADCQGGILLGRNGLPLPENSYIQLEPIVPAGYNDCSPESTALTTNIINLLSTEVVSCYQNKECQGVSWSPRDLQYTCPDDNRKDQMLSQLTLKFDVYCKVSSDLALTSLQLESEIPRNLQRCQDGRRKSIIHSFLKNPCPKQLERRENRELRRLSDSLSGCQGDCKSVSLSEYDFGELTCLLGDQGYTDVGVYWGCPDQSMTTLTTTESVLTRAPGGNQPKPTSNDHPKSQPHAILSTSSPAVKRKEEHIVIKGKLKEGEDNMVDKEGKYLTALIIVSVLLALVIMTLVGVIFYFLKIRGRNRRESLKNEPPSRQTLYSKMSPNGGSRVTSTRYESAIPAGETKITDYMSPVEGTDEEDVGNTYEMVDTDQSKYGAKSMTSVMRKNGQEDKFTETGEYAVPTATAGQQGVIARTDSAKYSDGYLLPTISKGK